MSPGNCDTLPFVEFPIRFHHVRKFNNKSQQKKALAVPFQSANFSDSRYCPEHLPGLARQFSAPSAA
jgi:hypothetical protein